MLIANILFLLLGAASGIIWYTWYEIRTGKAAAETENKCLQEQAFRLKNQFDGKIPKGVFLVLIEDFDAGRIMAGIATDVTCAVSSFREALLYASANCQDDDERVSILDDSAEMIVCGTPGKFILRIPEPTHDNPGKPVDQNTK